MRIRSSTDVGMFETFYLLSSFSVTTKSDQNDLALVIRIRRRIKVKWWIQIRITIRGQYSTVESTHRPVFVLFVASRPGTSQGLALKTTVI